MDNKIDENKNTESRNNRIFRGNITFCSTLVCSVMICAVLYFKDNDPNLYKDIKTWYFNNLSVSDINTDKLINQVSETFSSGFGSFKTCILDILCSLTS